MKCEMLLHITQRNFILINLKIIKMRWFILKPYLKNAVTCYVTPVEYSISKKLINVIDSS